MKSILNNTVFVYALITLIVLTILYFSLKRLGIISPPNKDEEKKTKEDIKDLIELDNLDKKYKSSLIWNKSNLNKLDFKDRLTTTKGSPIAREIYKAWGFFNDDEDQIYNAFNKIPSKKHVAEIAHYYFENHGKDLKTDIISKLDKSERLKLWDILERKP